MSQVISLEMLVCVMLACGCSRKDNPAPAPTIPDQPIPTTQSAIYQSFDASALKTRFMPKFENTGENIFGARTNFTITPPGDTFKIFDYE